MYTNNVLTSHGSEERPRFLDEDDAMGNETRMDPDPPRGLPMTDLTGIRRRDRQQLVAGLTVRPKAANPPKAPPPGHWLEPTRRQMMNERFTISLRHRSVPESVASSVDTAEWSHISLETDEQDRRDTIRDIDEALRDHLQDADGEWY